MRKLFIQLACVILLTGTLRAQNALFYDGVDDFVQTTQSGVLSSTNRTFEAWINVSPNAPSSNLTILDYGLNAVGSRNTFLVDANRGIRYLSGGTNANISSSMGAVVPGQWAHVAFVLDNGTGFLYINGNQVGTGSLTSVNTPAGNANMTIGQRVSGGSIPFNGTIDEIRIWNIARTAIEIRNNMNSELCSYPSSLVSYYKFNQGSANGNNTGLINVIGETGDTAVANNFNMTGLQSNWVSGAVLSPIRPLNTSISIDTMNQILSAMDTSSNVHYQWYDCSNNSLLVGDTNRFFSTRTSGSFAVILSNTSCTDTSACVSANFGGGIIPGEALHFDGVDDFIQCNYSGVLDSSNRTFEAWVNVSSNAPSSNLTILDYGLNAVGSRNTFLIDGTRGIRFISGGTNANISSSSGSLQPGQWEHVAFVLNNGTGYIYLNGIQVGTGSLSSVNTPAGNADLTIGERVSGGSIPFEGLIDEVRIWNVARSQNEISSHMNTTFCDSVPGLAAHFNFNNGVAGGNNTGISKVANTVNSGDGFLMNFALNGTTSNFDLSGANINFPVFDTSISQTGNTLSANDSLADSYQWIDCSSNLPIQGETNRSFTSTSNGTFAVILKKNGCADTLACVSVIGVGLAETNRKNSFSLSQNPIEESFFLNNSKGLKINTYIRSVTGRLLDEKRNVSKTRIDFNLSGEKAGIYLLRIEGEEGFNLNYKVIKL